MMVEFRKGKKGKPDTLTCIRDDGSLTWMPVGDGVGVVHDLMHYAVETTLGCREAFLGLVAQGKNLDEFGTQDGVKDIYTAEESYVECLVGAMQFPLYCGGEPPTDAETITLVENACREHGLPAPAFTLEQLARIRARFDSLLAQWRALSDGETLALPFPV